MLLPFKVGCFKIKKEGIHQTVKILSVKALEAVIILLEKVANFTSSECLKQFVIKKKKKKGGICF